MKISLFRNKLFLAVETFYLIIFPILLIYWKPELIHWRLLVMLASMTYVSFVMKTNKLSLRRIGFSRTNFIPALKDLIPITLIGIVSLLIGKFLDPSIWYINAVIDEVGGSRLELVSKNKNFLIWYSAIVFAVIHLPFGNWRITIVSLLMGLIYADNFLKYRNISAISIQHAILGSLMIYLMT